MALDEPMAHRAYDKNVIASIAQDSRQTYHDAARIINQSSAQVVNLQHEFGLFGGGAGQWCVELMNDIQKPVALTLHTVLPHPGREYLVVTRALCEAANIVIVLSDISRRLLVDIYDVPRHHVRVIPHGVPDMPLSDGRQAKQRLGFEGRAIITTFGFLSRGKGLEDALESMRAITRKHPEALYLILGQTHPIVKRTEGEAYRASLANMVIEWNLQANVAIIDRYLSLEEIKDYLSATDVYLTPYLNEDQVVSGTLAYALGAGRAVVSTPYLYAKELLAGGRGMLVNFRDPGSIAATLNALLDYPQLLRQLQERAYSYGRDMTWPNVAASYAHELSSLVESGSHVRNVCCSA
ncbi:MAG: glycosyltransferase [Candidatus Tyrphobacter sp.]